MKRLPATASATVNKYKTKRHRLQSYHLVPILSFDFSNLILSSAILSYTYIPCSMLQIRRVIELSLDRHRATPLRGTGRAVLAVLGSSSTLPQPSCSRYLSPPQICFYAGEVTRKSLYFCFPTAVDAYIISKRHQVEPINWCVAGQH